MLLAEKELTQKIEPDWLRGSRGWERRMDLSRTMSIKNELGLHARTAAQIARLAEEARGNVYLVKEGREANATDILDMLGLYCPRGTRVTVRIADPADEKVLDRIAEMIESGFGES